jgi:hypothetical protein
MSNQDTTIRSPFGEAWRGYISGGHFNDLPARDRALIRTAFVSGWNAAHEPRGSGDIEDGYIRQNFGDG